MNKEDINENKEDDILEEEIKQIFKKSKNNYGSRKIKKELEKKG
ncbi:HTH-like domain protein [Peptoanaerobacter stomatis]|uniref:HTH-like domain protein n=1 Tax=Peptoanaerobacter stomatis TaxID=796937 RepID=J5WKZ8_9FIRM|nr:HTH-like domain protein [Peptoanaerobacter stomatis]